MSTITNLTAQQLRQAADLKDQISALEKQLSQIVGASPAAKPVAKPAVAKPPVKKKGTISAAGKARIVAAQKARWAKIRAAKATIKPAAASPSPAPKPAVKASAPAAKPAGKPAAKSKMSAATKAALSAKLKAFWAKKKAAARK